MGFGPFVAVNLAVHAWTPENIEGSPQEDRSCGVKITSEVTAHFPTTLLSAIDAQTHWRIFPFERDAMTQWLSVGPPMHVVDLWPR
jgi:hypothetical protein